MHEVKLAEQVTNGLCLSSFNVIHHFFPLLFLTGDNAVVANHIRYYSMIDG
jgi:hypothetical protein